MTQSTMAVEVGSSRGDIPLIEGGDCLCGHRFTPMQTLGCEVCGRDGAALKPRDLGGVGSLTAVAVVHLHTAPTPPAPFAVVTVKLMDGPTVRGLMEARFADRLSIGETLVMRPPTKAAGPEAVWFEPLTAC